MRPTSLWQHPTRLVAALVAVTLLVAGVLVTSRAVQRVEASDDPAQGLGVIVRVRDGRDLRNGDIDAMGLEIVDDLGGGMYLLEQSGGALTFAEYQTIARDLHDTDLFEIAAANGVEHPLTAGGPTALDDPDAELATGVANPQTNAGWNLDIVDGALDGSYSMGPTGRGVYIYVVDSGVDPMHGDFTGRVLEIPGSDLVDVDSQPRPCTYEDGLGSHGHHVASTAAGFRYGLAKEATIVPIRVFGCSGETSTTRILQALNLALTDNDSRGNPPAVVNLSLGFKCDSDNNGSNGYDGTCAGDSTYALYQTRFNELLSAGLTVVVAAGNGGVGDDPEDAADACSNRPAALGVEIGVLTVGNSNVSDTRSPDSSYGSCLDLYAPGTSIPAADHRDRVGVMTATGTSMAAPLVAGAAALYLSAVADPYVAISSIVDPAERPGAVETFLRTHAASFVSGKTPDADKRLRLPATWATNSSLVTGSADLRLTFSAGVTGFTAGDITFRGSATGCEANLATTSASMYQVGVLCGGSGSATAVLEANSVALVDTSELGPDGPVTSAAVQSDGKIVLGGFFTNYNGEPAPYIVRLNADGSVDDTFDTGAGPDAGVQSLALQSDGKIIVGGDFANFDEVAAARMVRLHSDGSRDATFAVGTGPQSAPTALLVLDSGDVLVGGMFSSFDGFTQDAIVLIDSTGAVDTTYTVAPDTYGHVFVLELLANGKILVAGNFDGFGGVATLDIARLNADLTVDGTFARADDYYNHSIKSVAVQNDGNILVTGTGLYPLDETEADWDYRAFVERLSSGGGDDTTFTKALGNFMGGARTAIALLDGGDVLLGGNFSEINDSPVDPLVQLSGSGVLGLSLPVDAAVRHLFPYDDGILVVGSFTTYDDPVWSYATFDRPGILKLNTSGELDLDFQRTTAPATDLGLPTLTFDSTAPGLSSGIAAVSGSTGEVTFEISYTEGVRSLSTGDLSVSGTATGCAVTSTIGTGNYYNAKVACTGNGTVVLSLLANSNKDLVGNTGPASIAASSPYSMTGIASATTTIATSGGGGSSPGTTVPAASGGTITQPGSPVTTTPVTVPGRVPLPATPTPTTPATTTPPAPPAVPIRTTSTRTSGQLAGSTLGVAARRIGGVITSTNEGSVTVEVRNRKGRLVRTLAVNVEDGGKFTLFLPNGVYSVRIKANDGPNKGRTLWNVRRVRVG